MVLKLFRVCLIGLLTPISVYAQAFDNKAVISLHNAGLGEGTILTKINSLPCGYDVSTEGLISLKKAGVSDTIIAAMVDRCTGSTRAQGISNASTDPLIKRAPGIYVFQDWQAAKNLVLIRPAINSGVRTTGNGSALFPLKQLLQIPKTNSQNRIPVNRPAFYFYFNADDRNVSDFGVDQSRAAQSPNEFNLIRFKIKNGAREIEVGRASQYFSLSVRNGINPKDAIAFSVDEVGDGIFKVTPDQAIISGEYAFVFSGEKGGSRVYDFSIGPQPSEDAAIAPK